MGGPIMNETRCPAARRTPSSGSHFSMSTTAIPAAWGTSTELSSPETWASGEGMRATSAAPRPWAATIERAL